VPIYAVCMSLADPTGRAWAALDRAVGRRPPGQRWQARRAALAGSTCGPGRTAHRRGPSRPPSCPSPFWPACTASTSRPRPPGGTPVPGDRASYAADVSRWLEHRPDATTARTRHRPRSRACPRPGPGGRRRRPAAPDDRRVLAVLAPGALAANGRSRSPGSATPGHQDLAVVLARLSPALPPLTSSSHNQASATCCEIDHDPIAIFWG